MKSKFDLLKEEILDNMAILKYNYESCISAGFQDIESDLYNEIDLITDEIEVADSMEGLEETVIRAKKIENDLDVFLISLGQSTIGISWPI